MNLLLDSHTFVWWREEPHKLSKTAFVEISNSANALFLSAASVWELQIKIQNGRFSFSDTLEHVIDDERKTNRLQILPVHLAHALFLENLPLHHKDPFDRLLIAQSIVENMVLVSSDSKFSAYPVNLLW